MSRDRLIGFIIVGLVIAIIILFIFNRTNSQQLENENAELQSKLEEAQAKESSNQNADNPEDTENAENPTGEGGTSDSIDIENQSELIQSELETYDTFVSDFVDILMSYDDQKSKNEQLTNMTNESAQTYLKENYYILEDGQEVSEDEAGTHAEGDFEPLEMDMSIASIDTYYTYNNNNIEVVALYQTNTVADDEDFSGNYVLKGTLTKENGEIKFDTINSIVAINDPNAEELYE
ncbi:hypothetical protein [Salinicoccus albus]|uniref:hypothetical protein n=1 Tax=Salinicoccus albus TaxID=418756 RepID=UPI00035D4258|nr:hypothetical protein [Salinicoccus albus]